MKRGKHVAVWWGLALALAAVVVLVCLAPELADARPGGGSTFSGGGGSSGGGDGGELELVIFLIQLIIEWPEVGIPVTVLVILFYFGKSFWKKWRHRGKKRRLQEWDSAPALAHTPPPPDLQKIRRLDADFSSVLFEDFVFRLYAQAHQARSVQDELNQLAPYLSSNARNSLSQRRPSNVPVSNVVIGTMKVMEASIPAAPRDNSGAPNQVQVKVRFESNMTAGPPDGQHTYYVVEDWSMRRAADVQSRPPGAARDFPCPNCAAPFVSSDRHRCDYCGEVVDNGSHDWLVTSLKLLRSEERPPQVTGNVPERGTDRATVTSDSLDSSWALLCRDDPAVTEEALGRRFKLIYTELNAAWSALDLRGARPFVSDGLFNYLQYWIDTYKSQRMLNIMEDARLLRWTRVKIVRDKHYDALTIRFWATGLDYTLEERSGKMVGGSKTKPRDYSEYWTLIRGSGARGQASAEKRCPNCGGELKINMAGNCEFCKVHVTSGEFDWVLSKIEQDDSYCG